MFSHDLLLIKNDDIFKNKLPDTKYIQYTSSKGNNAVVLLRGEPIEIISETVKSLENNINYCRRFY